MTIRIYEQERLDPSQKGATRWTGSESMDVALFYCTGYLAQQSGLLRV